MARIAVEYEGNVLTLRGWLPSGAAMLNIPRGGEIEIFLDEENKVALICRDANGMQRPMRIEAGSA